MLGGFICITRVIQIVDTSRLDFEDVTWSNVNVAIWNMIEVHIGCVTANIPLMGPLFTRFGNLMHRFGLFGHKRNSETGGTGSSHSLAKHTLKGRIGVEHEFQRIDDFRFGPEKEGRTMTPTIGKGEAHSDDEFELASLGAQGIMVRRDLEQNSYMKPATQ
ncbi:MAG: hypothetical protein LQ338_002978 [Usnochroma carphineum]|nr:MAG: hypothetical protein LQ338_002978 [Usnochroma carphineum]